MSLLQWLQSLRRADRATSTDLRRQLETLRQQHDQMVAERDALALDAVNDDTVAERWQRLDLALNEIARRMQVLNAALPTAEAREADAARQAELGARVARMRAFERQTAADRVWADTVIGALPSGPVLTEARNRRDRQRAEATLLSRWSNDSAVRRPFDPLALIYDALAHRLARIDRARWIHARHPITLGTVEHQEEIAKATERIAALEGHGHD